MSVKPALKSQSKVKNNRIVKDFQIIILGYV